MSFGVIWWDYKVEGVEREVCCRLGEIGVDVNGGLNIVEKG